MAPQQDYVSSSFEQASTPASPDASTSGKDPAQSLRVGILILGFATVVGLSVAFPSSPVRAAWEQLSSLIELRSDNGPVSASPAKLSEHDVEDIGTFTSQQQAERLLERSINGYAGAIEMLNSHLDSWHGHLQRDRQMQTLITTALNANDLQVRAAALEVQIVVDGLKKDAATVDRLIQSAIESAPGQKAYDLWALGMLGNRGVEPERVREALMSHLNDPEVEVRQWAVEGLAHLGTDDVIAPLLDKFHNDSSPIVRERAGCSIAQSGMLNKDQRMRAVPELLKFTDDPSLDAQTRAWTYQALRDITGQSLPSDPAAWRNWYSAQR